MSIHLQRIRSADLIDLGIINSNFKVKKFEGLSNSESKKSIIDALCIINQYRTDLEIKYFTFEKADKSSATNEIISAFIKSKKRRDELQLIGQDIQKLRKQMTKIDNIIKQLPTFPDDTSCYLEKILIDEVDNVQKSEYRSILTKKIQKLLQVVDDIQFLQNTLIVPN